MNTSPCGHRNRPGAKFCDECGARLASACAQCGTELRDEAKFCDECGAPVETQSPSASASPGRPADSERSPRDYTPKHLADKILQSKSALEGELKQVTVLFADIQGSMKLAEQLGPEGWHAVLDRFFEILTRAMHRYEGTVNQYTGDGIMALFGAPIAHEDHAQRAAHAALEVLEQLAPFARELERQHSITLSARVGLNSGEVVVGRIGDDLRMDYTAQGHTVGLAQRLESLASPNTIYVSESTSRLLGSLFELEDLGSFQLKGSNDERVFQLLATGQHQTRFDQARARGFSRFVGRESDTRLIAEALAQAKAGNGQVVGVVAEAGTGKSRLCFEFVEQCRSEGLDVSVGRALAHGRDILLLPILEAFRSYYGVEDHDEAVTVREKISGHMLPLDASFEEDLPLLFEFFGVPDPDRPAAPINADALQRRLFEILRRTTRLSAGEGRATVILIEDLHWLDSASEEFLAEWVDATAGTHTLLLLNFRPEYQPEWIGRSYYRQMPLGPLDESSIGELTEDLIGSDPSTRGLVEKLHQRTRGNPFFAEEILQSLIESGDLVGDRGRYRLAGAADELSIPETVQAVLASRIDRLGEREKEVLQSASVIGKEFAEPVLREVIGLSERELASTLEALARAEFVREADTYPVLRYAFKHPLTQEVALGSQLQDRRRQVHAATAAAMERFYSGELDEKAALIAHHLEEAGDSFSAAAWHARAARWASRTNWKQGNRHSRRVLSLTQPDASSSEVGALRLEAIRDVFLTGWRLGINLAEVEPLLNEARDLARSNGDLEAEINLLTSFALFVGNRGDARRYHALSAEASSLLDDRSSREIKSIVHFHRSYSALCLGRLQESLDEIEKAIEVAKGDHEVGMTMLGIPLWSLGTHLSSHILCDLGRLEDAREARSEVEVLLESEPRTEVSTWVAGDHVRIAQLAGDVAPWGGQDHRPRLAEALEYCESIGTDLALVTTLTYVGLAHGLVGDWRRACEALLEATEYATTHRTHLGELAIHRAWHAWALHGAGDFEAASEAATRAIDWGRDHGLEYQEALGRLERAKAARELHGVAARETIDEDLTRLGELIEATGARSLQPQYLEERARLEGLLGSDPRKTLEEALKWYREIGAGGHSARLAAELGPNVQVE